MYCPFCGNDQKEDVRFCTNCGRDVQSDEVGKAQPVQPLPAVNPGNPVTKTTSSLDQVLGAPAAVTDPNANYYGYGGIALAVIAWFTGIIIGVLILGIAAVYLGYTARQKGATRLGLAAMAIGAIDVILGFLALLGL